MKIKSLLYKACICTSFICMSTAAVNAATITQTVTWSMFSGPNDAQVEETRLINLFDPSLGTMTRIDWAVQGGISANFQVMPSSFPIEYSFAAAIGCGIAIPSSGIAGCDLISNSVISDVRIGSTFGSTGVNETIFLSYFGSHTFTDQGSLDLLTGVSSMNVSLLVDTEALAQSCIPDPFGPGEVCNSYEVGYFGDYTGTFTVSYTYDPVPIPAAIWLFGSGLVGLIGVARRRPAAGS